MGDPKQPERCSDIHREHLATFSETEIPENYNGDAQEQIDKQYWIPFQCHGQSQVLNWGHHSIKNF
jgi:hypothetical protein